MKAAVCYEFGEPLVVEEIEIDPPQMGEVKVKVAACAICHSDVHWIRGEWGGETPMVVGHEVAGIITQVGSGVSNVKPGDAVVVSLLRSCGHCFYCTIGRPYNCEGEFPLDRESRLRNKEGVRLVHGLRTAGFAEYTVVDQSQVVKIREGLPLDRACLLACGVVTGLGAVVNTVQVETGSCVVVIGTGGVGLNSLQGAVLSGAAKIIGVDLLDNKLEAARLFGATHTINARRQDAVAAVLELTQGCGADYAFATVGSSTAITQAVRMIRKGGTAVIVGMPANDDAAFTLSAHELTYGRTVIGSLMGSTRLSVDVPRLVELYQQGRLKLDELITDRYPLEEINTAIESMERGEALKFDPVGPYSAFDPRQLSLEALERAEKFVKNIREVVGSKCDLLFGTHGQMTTSSTIRLARRLERFDPLWLEEPVPPENVEEMARVARSTSIPIASGERLTTKYEFARLLGKQAASILQMALGRVGGILEAKKIAGMAEAHYAQIAPHLYCGPIEGAANIQIGACSPNFLIQEGIKTWGGFHAEILKEPIRWEEGYIIPPTKPGLGVELNEEVAARHPYTGKRLHLEPLDKPL